MSIKPTKDIYGNRIFAKTTIDAIKTVSDDADPSTLGDVFKRGIIKDIDVEVGTMDWTQISSANATFYKEFDVPDISEYDNPLFLLKPAGDIATTAETKAFNNIAILETFDGKIRVYVVSIPDTAITITLKNITNRSYEV